MTSDWEKIAPESCLNRADPNEMVFVLLARDVAAPAAIRSWCSERIRLNKNTASDPQITEALACASVMEQTQAEHHASRWSSK